MGPKCPRSFGDTIQAVGSTKLHWLQTNPESKHRALDPIGMMPALARKKYRQVTPSLTYSLLPLYPYLPLPPPTRPDAPLGGP